VIVPINFEGITMRHLALTFVLVGLVGCGDEGTGMDMGMEDMAMPDLNMEDMTQPPDFSGVSCGTMTCGTGEECCAMVSGGGLSAGCVTAGSCGMDGGSAAIQCDGPEDCPGMMTGSAGCCVTVAGNFGNPDAGTMTAGSGSSSCGAHCAGNLIVDQTTGDFSVQTKLCHAKADCKGYSGTVFGAPLNFDGCCTAAQSPYAFCFSTFAATQTMNAVDCSKL
jgi:hypothetical protein